ncbi:hypothetical protein EMIT0194P_120160 [Pseudomonas serbica]
MPKEAFAGKPAPFYNYLSLHTNLPCESRSRLPATSVPPPQASDRKLPIKVSAHRSYK